MGQNCPQNTNYSLYGHFLTNRAEIFFGNSEDYYLSISDEKSWIGAFLKNSIFGGIMGVAATLAPKGLGRQDPTKKLNPPLKLQV